MSSTTDTKPNVKDTFDYHGEYLITQRQNKMDRLRSNLYSFIHADFAKEVEETNMRIGKKAYIISRLQKASDQWESQQDLPGDFTVEQIDKYLMIGAKYGFLQE